MLGIIVRVADENTFTVNVGINRYFTVRVDHNNIDALKKEFDVDNTQLLWNKRVVLNLKKNRVFSERNQKGKGVPCSMHSF